MFQEKLGLFVGPIPEPGSIQILGTGEGRMATVSSEQGHLDRFQDGDTGMK